LVALSGGGAFAALKEPKVGLHTNLPQAFQGYTLFAPHTLTDTYLVDMRGKVVHRWTSDSKPALSVRLLDNGDLLRPARVTFDTPFDQGGHGGRVELLDWNSNLVWSVQYASQTHLQHHDALLLPNGHVLMIAWDRKTAAEAIDLGRNASLLKDHDLWPDSLVEIDPATNEEVWDWDIWDHLVQDLDPTKPNFGNPADEAGRVDVTYTTNGGDHDWTHAHQIDYDPAPD